MVQRDEGARRRVLFGSCAYMLFMMAGCGLHAPLYGEFRAYFGVSLFQLSLAVASCQLFGAVTGVVAARVLGVIGPRRAMLCGSAVLCAFGLSMCFLRSLAGVFLGFTLLGVNCGMFIQGCVTELMMRWFDEGRERAIALCMGAGVFGVAVGQSMSGFLYGATSLGVGGTLLVCAASLAALCALVAIALIKDGPEADASEKTTAAENGVTEKPKQSMEAVPKGVFAPLAIATLLTNCAIAMAGSYLTPMLTDQGVDFGVGAACVSVMGFASGVVTLVSGSLMARFGTGRYVVFSSVCAALCNAAFCAAGIGDGSALPLLVLGVGAYAFGYGLSMIHNMVSVSLFKDRAVATAVNTRLISCFYAGAVVLGPALSLVAEHYGFATYYGLCAILCLVCAGCYSLAFVHARKLEGSI